MKNIMESIMAHAGYDIQRTEEGFTPDQISRLRKEWGTVDRINPSSEQYKALQVFIQGLNKEQLKELQDADIKFVSIMARNALKR